LPNASVRPYISLGALGIVTRQIHQRGTRQNTHKSFSRPRNSYCKWRYNFYCFANCQASAMAFALPRFLPVAHDERLHLRSRKKGSDVQVQARLCVVPLCIMQSNVRTSRKVLTSRGYQSPPFSKSATRYHRRCRTAGFRCLCRRTDFTIAFYLHNFFHPLSGIPST
jgi:hypothetical protein